MDERALSFDGVDDCLIVPATPETYEFTVPLNDGPPHEQLEVATGSYRDTIKVPEMAQAYSDEPLDLGELVLETRQSPHLRM